MDDLPHDRRNTLAPKETIADATRKAAIFRIVSLRLLPFLFLLYMMNILDRVNVGFAKLTMLEDLGLSNEVFGQGYGIFFIGYFLFEVPSNLLLRRVGARRWIGRIMITWGLISIGMMFIRDSTTFYLLRFLLGVAEAGFFPGIIYYLSNWFPARERARAISRFMTASAVAGLIGNPVSGGIMDFMHNVAGLPGWQWLFILEGLPAVALGIATLFYLTDRPEQANWLQPDDRAWLAERMNQEERGREERHGLTLLRAAADPRVWLLCAVYFTVSMGANSYGAYAPTLIKERFKPFFPGITELHVGLLAMIPALVTIIAMVLVGTRSDRTGERRGHIAGSAFVAALGWTIVAVVDRGALGLFLVGMALAYAGMMSMLAPFWSLPTSFLSGAAAAGGIAFINSVGNLGGYVGPLIIGKIQVRTGHFMGALLILGAAMLAGGILVFFAPHDTHAES